MRLKDKVAIVVGAGQSPGEGMGNGRATVLRFVEEGAKVLAVDNVLASAEETVAMARQSGAAAGDCIAFEADVTKETTLAGMAEATRRRWGRIDVLHYNVGVSIAISSVAAWEQYPNVVYKASKAGMIAFTQQIAIQNAEFGIRANVILPGLMDTPMAVDTRARASGKSR